MPSGDFFEAPSLAVGVEQVLADVAEWLPQVSTCLGDTFQGFLDGVRATHVNLDIYSGHGVLPYIFIDTLRRIINTGNLT